MDLWIARHAVDWLAVAYHATLFSGINPAAWLFAAMFLIQAGLLTCMVSPTNS